MFVRLERELSIEIYTVYWSSCSHCPLEPIADYKIAGHWPFSEQISKVATQNMDQLRLNCMDGRPNEVIYQPNLQSILHSVQ